MNETRCKCGTLDDLVVVDAVRDDGLFKTLIRIKSRGEPWWWLSFYSCCDCQQAWLVASEERQNDIYCLRRLDRATGRQVILEDLWPPDFDKYEALLKLGRDAGHKVTFANWEDSDLIQTIADLARERPGIPVSDLASLLNLKISEATGLATIAVNLSGVNVGFESVDVSSNVQTRLG